MPLSHLLADDIRALRGDAARLDGCSERERIARLADRAARSALPVLIEGEPGSGSRALARAIHDCGERKERPFLRFEAASLLAVCGFFAGGLTCTYLVLPLVLR